jgi:hypothetical protein
MWKRQTDLATRLTLRGYLVLLTLAIILPVLVFAGILYVNFYNSELDRLERNLQSDARQLSLTVDRDISGLLNTLQTLTASTRITINDYEGFFEQAQHVRDMIGVNILLRERNGQQVVNTRRPWGAPLPLEPLVGDREVLETRKPFV